MSIYPGQSEPMKDGDSYVFKLKHRNKKPIDASKWTISCQEEFDMCEECNKEELYDTDDSDKYYYNMKNNGDIIGYRPENDKLRIARYEKNATGVINEWHGYPIDFAKRNDDIPPETVLEKFYKLGKIGSGQIVYILRGKDKF